MSNHDPHEEMDELVREVRDRFLARADAEFDFEAGLADIRARAALPRPPVGVGTTGVGADLCAAIDALASILATESQLRALREQVAIGSDSASASAAAARRHQADEPRQFRKGHRP